MLKSVHNNNHIYKKGLTFRNASPLLIRLCVVLTLMKECKLSIALV
jgi:hypothetical protein